MRVKYIIVSILVATAVFALTACGQTGDLYLPDADERRSKNQEEELGDVTEDGSF